MNRPSKTQLALLLLALGSATDATRAAETATPLPSLAVVSPGVPGENKMVGTYAQPEWSARRPFPGVSVYVQPAAQIEFESGFQETTTPSGRHHREWTQELEAGLGHRWQLAVENTVANFHEGSSRPPRWGEDAVAVAVRYALADWGKLPLNPAVGAGWEFKSGTADVPNAQLVLGDEFTPRLHWAADCKYGRQTGGRHLRDLSVATALTYSVTNETLNVGVQAQWKRSSETLDPQSTRLEAGPCVQYRPIDQLHFDCVALWGRERGKPVHGLFLSVGFEFGPGADDHDDERERGGRLAH